MGVDRVVVSFVCVLEGKGVVIGGEIGIVRVYEKVRGLFGEGGR